MSTSDRTVRVLITGAGEPAAIGFMHLADPRVEFIAADPQPDAAGFDLVPEAQRAVVPYGEDSDYIETIRALCLRHGVSMIVPMLDAEIAPLVAARERLAADGVEVVFSPAQALAACLDVNLMARLYAPESIEPA